MDQNLISIDISIKVLKAFIGTVNLSLTYDTL